MSPAAGKVKAAKRADDHSMRWWPKQRPATSYAMDELGVRRLLGGDVVEQVRWDQLTAVDVVTTSGGPWKEDLFFVLRGAEGTGVLVASGLAPAGFVERLGQLDGFDDKQVIRAAGTSTNAHFPCWPTMASADQTA